MITTLSTETVIIGAGQAGLAMSRCLTDRSIDHVVLERGEVANSWRTERWDSLRLLTPNWMTRLPGYEYTGGDPDGFMKADEVGDFLGSYGAGFEAPVITHCEVSGVEHLDDGYLTRAQDLEIRSKTVVIASGACSTPRIPAIASSVPDHIQQVAPIHYRNPDELGTGRVLVVGASASGAQIADELQRSGRDVTLAVGDHVRLPRSYRGMDIHWWMETIGLLNDRFDEVEDIVRARRLPSLQLIGTPEKRSLDLNALSAAGVQLVGRFAGVSGRTAQFSGSFANQCKSADLKLGRLLDSIDEFVAGRGIDAELGDIDRPAPTVVPAPTTGLDLSDVDTIVWATGFRPNYPWLDDRVLDHKGAIRHTGGVVDAPGMYVLGLPFNRRRKSSFIDGVGLDAIDLSAHLAGHLEALSVSRSAPA